MLAQLEWPGGKTQALLHQRLVLVLVPVLLSVPAGAAQVVEVSRVVNAMHASGVAPPWVVEPSWVVSWLLHHQRHLLEVL